MRSPALQTRSPVSGLAPFRELPPSGEDTNSGANRIGFPGRNLANLYTVQHRYDEAEPLHLETLETKKRVLGEGHPSTLSTTNCRRQGPSGKSH